MAVGLLALTNHKLLTEILSRFPDAIRSVPDFIDKIKPGEKFFSIVAAPEVGLYDVKDYHLVSVKEYNGDFKCFKGSMWYMVRFDNKEHSLNDLLGGGNACFINSRRAKDYHDTLAFHWKELIGII